MQALIAALNEGAVPDLIYLDMRGNPLTEAGVTSLVSSNTTTCFFIMAIQYTAL